MTDLSFGKSSRLLNASDYQAVFDGAELKVSKQQVLYLARLNGKSHSRLGLVIAKKNIRLAVQRNRIKRILRECFRTQQGDIGVDIVVLARRGLDEMDNPSLHTLFSQLLGQLQGKAKRKLTETGTR